jgi:hypothetical protein
MTNDYKVTAGKPPVVSAVFIPFRRTLLALAAMMERQAVRHKLQGARDPYQEWRQLPNAQAVLLEAAGRHSLDPWGLNTKDAVGDHPGDLHLLHALWGFMAAHEKHLDAQDARGREAVLDRELAAHRAALFHPDQDLCCGAPDATPVYLHKEGPVPGCDCPNCLTWQPQLKVGTASPPPGPINGPAGADWRERRTIHTAGDGTPHPADQVVTLATESTGTRRRRKCMACGMTWDQTR